MFSDSHLTIMIRLYGYNIRTHLCKNKMPFMWKIVPDPKVSKFRNRTYVDPQHSLDENVITEVFRIRKSEVWIRTRILLKSCKNSKKTLDFHCFVISYNFSSVKNNVNVPSKSNKKETKEKNNFLLASWRSLKRDTDPSQR